MVGKYKNREHQDWETTASSKTITIPWDTCQSNRDLSRDQEARDAVLAKTIAEAVTREMAKAHAHYQALLNDISAAAIPTRLFSMTEAQLQFQPALRLLQEQWLQGHGPL